MSDNAAMTITEFLEARIDEDEALAEAASVSMHGQRHREAWDYASYVLSSERDATEAQDKFIAEWWPARALAECAAKRAILAAQKNQEDNDDDMAWIVASEVLLKTLAAIYADHPDYMKEWAE